MLILLFLFLGFIGFFVLLSLIFIPFQFLFSSIINIVSVPYQLIKIAFNKQLRANHALEHATINVIEERVGQLNLTGMGRENGFIIQGPLDPYLIEEAARIGLMRLKNGEANLAIHRRCGTSILAANLVTSILIIYLLWNLGFFGILYIIFALLAAQVVGPPLGYLFQKYVTTSLDVSDLEIVGIEPAPWPHWIWSGIALPVSGRYFVRTRKVYSF